MYDVHFTEEEGSDEAYYAAAKDDKPDDEDLLCYFLEQNDADAIYITEFEDSIVDTIQESDLPPVYISYQEARQKLRDNAKAKGLFGVLLKAAEKGSYLQRRAKPPRMSPAQLETWAGTGPWR